MHIISDLPSFSGLVPIFFFLNKTDYLNFLILNKITGYFEINNELTIILIITTYVLIVSSFLAFKIIIYYYSLKFVLMKEYLISLKVFKNYLKQSYSFLLKNNTIDLSKNILSEVSEIIHGVFLPLLNIITHFFTLSLILIFLIIYQTKITFIIIIIFMSFFLLFYFFSKKEIARIGKQRFDVNSERFRIVNNGFRLLREIKFRNLENFFFRNFEIPAYKYSQSQVISLTLASLPKYAIEILVILIGSVYIIYNIYNNIPLLNILPNIIIFSFAAYRILPSISQLYYNYTLIKYSSKSLDKIKETFNLMDKNNLYVSKKQILNLNHKLELENVSFKYSEKNNHIIDNINIKFKKGDIIGLFGNSGSGKTTFINILLGLLTPTSGVIKFDNEKIINFKSNNLNKLISFVPQDFYLLDLSIKENICIGLENHEINKENLENAIRLSRLDVLVKDKGIDFIIGENGNKLSGGQRQRISLARSLYYKPKMLILDEATSSLDKKTELEIINDIINPDVATIVLVVSHDKELIDKCNIIYKIQNTNIIKIK